MRAAILAQISLSAACTGQSVGRQHRHSGGCAPDGYAIVLGIASTVAVKPLVMKNVPYDSWKDFAPTA